MSKIENSVRSDFHLSNLSTVTSGYKALISYSKKNGNPTKQQVVAFFEKELPQLEVCIESSTRVGDSISVFASAKAERKPITESSKMTQVVADLHFMDSALGTCWEVVEENGTKVLRQLVKTDADAILQKRISLMHPQSQVTASIGVPVAKGDKVKFFVNYAIHVGTIKELIESKKKNGTFSNLCREYVIDSEGVKYTVQDKNVFELVERAPASVVEQKNIEQSYWEQVLGPKLAKDLVK